MLGLRRAGKNKLCLGYSNVALSYLEKARDLFTLAPNESGGLRDEQDLDVEDFGLADNLMIMHGLELSGHSLVVPPQPVADPLRDLTAFEACVSIVARYKARFPD